MLGNCSVFLDEQLEADNVFLIMMFVLNVEPPQGSPFPLANWK